MARIIFTHAERAQIEAILIELEPTRHELTRPYADRLRRRDWQFVAEYIRKELRGLLEMSVMARAVADQAMRRGLANEEGVNDFLASRSWVRNFDIADADDERFMTIARSLGRPEPQTNYDLSTDADTLMEIAEQRMHGNIDDEYRRLLREMGT